MFVRRREKYLRTRGVSGPWVLEGRGSAHCDYSGVTVIPSLAEGEELYATLASLAAQEDADCCGMLVVVVVNQRVGADEAVARQNRADLEHLRTTPYPFRLAWVDAAGAGKELPPREGVGLARKIGFDLALTVLSDHPRTPLLSLDADTLVSSGYWCATLNQMKEGSMIAAEIPFAHRLPEDPHEREAILQYELFLRFHQVGLAWAGSPYAFQAIGSALVCSQEGYLACGGMNRRQGGEDFYFLQQLAKIGKIGRIAGAEVYPSARISSRNPFGTGPALRRILDGGGQLFYPREAYRVLREWLGLVHELIGVDGGVILDRAHCIEPELWSFLQQEKFVEFWQGLDQRKGGAQRLRAFTEWFDGLKGLRLIHHLCGGPMERIGIDEALDQFLPLAGGATGMNTLDASAFLREKG